MNKPANNKILIATGIYPPDIGGPATILRALVSSLVQKGFLVKVITYSEKKSENLADNVYRINRQANPILSHLKYFLKFKALAGWADVIYVTDVYSVGYFAYILNKLAAKKYIVRFAGDSAWETAVAKGWTQDYLLDFVNKIYNSKIEKLKIRRKKILMQAAKVIAVSHFMAKIAERIGVPAEKIKIIYNSVDFLQDKIDEEQVVKIRQTFDQNAKIIVTACRLMPWKGVDGIIQMLPRLQEKFGPVNFLVLGEGPELTNLKSLAQKLNLEKNVHFLGRVKQEEIINYFKAADLFILNSNFEGLSHTLLEVIKAGTPIITTNIGGNPEVITDGEDGLLINYNNGDELLAASLKILTDSQLVNRLAANAREKLEKFNWQKTIDETVQVLNEVNYDKNDSN